MRFRSPQALIVPSLRSGYYSSAFGLLNLIDTYKTVYNLYIVTYSRKVCNYDCNRTPVL